MYYRPWLGGVDQRVILSHDVMGSLFRVAEHQVGRLTGHTQEVCGLGEHPLE